MAHQPLTNHPFSAHALTPAETGRLLARLGGPDPDPAAPPEQRLEAAGYTAEEAYRRLQDVMDPDLMVIAAILRGTLKRLPPDPRLSPKPLPPAGPPRPTLAITGQQPVNSTNEKPIWMYPDAVVTEVIPNPRKKNTLAYDLYQKYAVGLTIQQLLDRGLTKTDLRWDFSRSHVKASRPTQRSSDM